MSSQQQQEHVLFDQLLKRRWDDAMTRIGTEEGREELTRQNKRGRLPLRMACSWGAPLELVEAMVKEYREAVRVPSVDGVPPLHEACIRNDDNSPRLVRLLLDAYPEGAKATDKDGFLPLYYAALGNAPVDVFRMLIDAHPEGASTRTTDGLPLHRLAHTASPREIEDTEKVEVLIRPLLEDEEACLVPDPRSGETPLHIGAKFDVLNLHTCLKLPRCPVEVIEKVAKRHPGQLRETDESGNLPLHVAASNPNLNGAQHEGEDIIGKWARLYPESAAASNGEGRFPLVLAIESGKKWNEGVEAIADAAEHIIPVRDERTNLYPFMLASTGDDPCITTVYSLLRRCPELKRYILD